MQIILQNTNYDTDWSEFQTLYSLCCCHETSIEPCLLWFFSIWNAKKSFWLIVDEVRQADEGNMSQIVKKWKTN
jgi:hypothetical protein